MRREEKLSKKKFCDETFCKAAAHSMHHTGAELGHNLPAELPTASGPVTK